MVSTTVLLSSFPGIEPASRPGEVLHVSKVSITIDSENQVVWVLMAEFFPAGILWFAERANEMSLSVEVAWFFRKWDIWCLNIGFPIKR